MQIMVFKDMIERDAELVYDEWVFEVCKINGRILRTHVYGRKILNVINGHFPQKEVLKRQF